MFKPLCNSLQLSEAWVSEGLEEHLWKILPSLKEIDMVDFKHVALALPVPLLASRQTAACCLTWYLFGVLGTGWQYTAS